MRLLLAVAAAAVLALPASASAAFPGRNGRIVFTSAHRLYTVDAAGGPWARLVATEERQGQAAWSPDGTRVAFRMGLDGDTEIWVVNADGGGLRQVTDTPNVGAELRYSSQPSWSPDGRRIVFRSDRRDNNPDLYVANEDGSDVRPLVQTPGDDRYGALSPDGTKLVYRSDVDGDPEIFVAGADGTNPVQVTSNGAFDSSPAWSPDSTRIAFERGDAGADVNSSPAYATTELWSVSAGAGEQQLTANGLHDEGAAWAPDNSGAVVFTREEAGNSDLWIREAGGAERRLTAEPSLEESPDWQPLPAGAAPVAKPKTSVAVVLLLTKRVRVSRTGSFAIRLRSPTGYRGPLSLTLKKRRLAATTGRIAAGKTLTIRLRLGAPALRRLLAARRQQVKVPPASGHLTLLAPR